MYIDEVKLKLDHFAGKFIGFFIAIRSLSCSYNLDIKFYCFFEHPEA